MRASRRDSFDEPHQPRSRSASGRSKSSAQACPPSSAPTRAGTRTQVRKVIRTAPHGCQDQRGVAIARWPSTRMQAGGLELLTVRSAPGLMSVRHECSSRVSAAQNDCSGRSSTVPRAGRYCPFSHRRTGHGDGSLSSGSRRLVFGPVEQQLGLFAGFGEEDLYRGGCCRVSPDGHTMGWC